MAEAATVYDRVGRWQDTQGFYERRAVSAMVAAARLDEVGEVLEVGCGTGALAARLLEHELPPTARYVGIDISPRMVELSRRRLRPHATRARVVLVDGRSPWPVADGACERVLAAYVLDLLSPEAIDGFFAEAHRVLRPGGLVALTSLAPGRRGVARAVSTAWSWLWRTNPHLTGGCRPLALDPHIPTAWRRVHDATRTDWGVCSRSIVLEPRPSG